VNALLQPFTVPFMGRALAAMVILAVLCGPVSVLVFARRLSFVADALTHTVFPGVVIGFVAGGPDGIFPGALIAGVLTAVVLTLLTRGDLLSDDAATAVVLTAMFSIGVAIVSRRSSYTSDLTALLFGRILTVSPRQLAEMAVLAVLILAMLAVGARAWVFRSFDAAGAQAAGFRTGRLDLWLNLVVALVVVAAVRAVGTVLVIALLVVPAAAARMVTDRLAAMALAGTALTLVAGYLGLLVSWTASIDFGVRLTSGTAVVLLLVLGYVLLLPVGLLRAHRSRPTVLPS
jgi:ABC-type Mn2+/Zn2+ transport system permease subunit